MMIQCRLLEGEGFRIKKNPFFLVVLALVLVAFPLDVMAACDATGLFTMGGGKGQCDTTSKGIIATTLCLFEQTLAQVLATLYCGFQTQLKGPITAFGSMAIAIFGISVFTGYIRLTFREAIIMVLKLGLVFTFVTISDFGIKIAGKMALALLQQGTQIAVSSLGGNTSVTQPDDMLTGILGLINNPDVTATNVCGAGDCLNKTIMKIFSNCALVLAILGLTLLFFMPAIVVFIVTMLLQYLKLFIQSLLHYLSSVIILTFLLALSPLFISFVLFKVTTPLFERWVQYVTSFSIQGMILFSFLILLGLVTRYFTMFIYQVMALLRPYDITLSALLMTIPIPHGCSICEYKVTLDAYGKKVISCQTAVQAGLYNTNIPQRIVVPDQFPPNAAVDGINATAPVPVAIDGSPITYKLKRDSVLSNVVNDIPVDTTQDGGRNYVIPLQNLLKETDFLLFMLTNLVSLWVVAKVMQEFIQKAPELASALGGVMSHGLSGKTGYESGISFPGLDKMFDSAGGYVAESMRSGEILSKNKGFFRRVGAGMLGVSGAALVKASSSTSYNPFSSSGGGVFSSGGGNGGGATPASSVFSSSGSAFSSTGAGTFTTAGTGGGPFASTGAGVFTPMTEEQVAKEREERIKQEKESQKRVDEAAKELQTAQEQKQRSEQGMKQAQEEKERLEEAFKNKRDDGLQVMTASMAFIKAKEAFEQADDKANSQKKVLEQRKVELSNLQYLQKKNMLPATATSAAAAGLAPKYGTTVGGTVLGGRAVGASVMEKREEKQKKQVKGRTVFSDKRAPTGPITRNDATNDKNLLLEAQENASKKVETLEKQFNTYGSLMTAAEREKFQKSIDKTKEKLGEAHSAKDVNISLYDLSEMELTLGKFSGKNILQGAVTSGISGADLALGAAAATVPSAYLQDAKKSVEKLKEDAKNAQNDKQLQKVAEDVTQVPGKVMHAAISAAGQQYANASLIVPEETLNSEYAMVKKAEADSGKTTDAKEQVAITKSLREYPDKLLSNVVGVLGTQQDMAHTLVTSEYLADFDKQMEDARERLKHAQTGDQYNQILKDLSTAPEKMVDGVIKGLDKQSENLSEALTEEQREEIKEALDKAKEALKNAKTGDDYNAILKDLADVSQEMKSAQEESGASTLPEQVIPATAIGASGRPSGGLMSALTLGTVAGAPPAPKTLYGQSNDDKKTNWRSTKDIGASIKDTWDTAGQRIASVVTPFNNAKLQPGFSPAGDVWDELKRKIRGGGNSGNTVKPLADDEEIAKKWKQIKSMLYS